MKIEYHVVAMAVQESTWLTRLLDNLYQDTDYIFPLYGDNESAILLIRNPIFHIRTKHIEIHHQLLERKLHIKKLICF